MENESNENMPIYFDTLSQEDRAEYEELRNVLTAPDHRYNRNKRIVTFQDMLDQIKKFCVRGDSNDWKRYLVCGICWVNGDIAINTRQLRILLGKSKSTINGAFSKMNYETLPFKNNNAGLQEKIPFLKGNFAEARQWTVRRHPTVCVSDSAPVDLQIQEKEAPKNNEKTIKNNADVLEFPSQDDTDFTDLGQLNYQPGIGLDDFELDELTNQQYLSNFGWQSYGIPDTSFFY